MPRIGQAHWAEVDTDTATSVVATKSGAAGVVDIVTGVSISASQAPAAAITVTLTSGGTTRESWQIPAQPFLPVIFDFPHPLRGSEDADWVLTVPSGGSGCTVSAVLRGYTERA